jgi:hypothetical protein
MKNYILQIAGSVCLLMSIRSGSMKSKLVAMAGGFAYVFIAVISMPVHAEEIHAAVSGSNLCLGVGDDSSCLDSVGHTVSIQLKEKGEKYNKDGNTAIGHSSTTFMPTEGLPWSPLSICFKDGVTPGFLFEYDYSSAVSTTPNGDLIYVELDDAEPSELCVSPDLTNYEVTVYRKITGGTGQYAGACGWVDFNGTGIFLAPDTSLASIDGTQVGEIFVGDDCP